MSKYENVLTWNEWTEKHKPILNPRNDSSWFDTMGEDFEALKNYAPNQIWTMIDGEGTETDLVAGLHWVNRLAYCVSEIPWTRDDMMVTDSPD